LTQQKKHQRFFMESKNFLNQNIKVKIDRPIGSKHPRYGHVYPINYGYIPGVLGKDGEELDTYILGVHEPLTEFEGQCIAVIHRINDNDDKLIVVPCGKEFSDDEIRELTEFQEKYFESVIIR